MASPRHERDQITLELSGDLGVGANVRVELAQLPSPLGTIHLAVTSKGLCALDFDSEARLRKQVQRTHPGARIELGDGARPAALRLAAYFDGDLHALKGLATDLVGTAFQKEVWAALLSLKPGQTKSYGELAAAIGRPAAVRAVGGANARNPVALVVPCHRVIAADGTLGGYRAGLRRKAWLLRHEGALAGRQLELI